MNPGFIVFYLSRFYSAANGIINNDDCVRFRFMLSFRFHGIVSVIFIVVRSQFTSSATYKCLIINSNKLILSSVIQDKPG